MRSPSLKVEDQGSQSSTPELPTKAAPPAPLWQKIDGKPLVEKVKIVEAASDTGLAAMREIMQIMAQHEQSDPGVKFELSSLKKVLEQKKERPIYIGLLGASGSGKSSLINALLCEERLLPVSHEGASTAVIVEISYNARTDYRYVAEVVPLAESEIRKELEQLFDDKKASDAQEKGEDDEEFDPELRQRMDKTFKKYTCVFKALTSLDALNDLSVEELLKDQNARNILGQRRIFEKNNLREFSRSIKPYIDTSKDVNNGFYYSLWPLVKVVKLYIQADILKTGIVLVDLPGSHDTSVARSQMAAQYMKNLALCCVTSVAKRAATDKGAQDILSDVQRRTMQLDGLYLKDSIFFIVTQIDASLDTKSYIDDHPEMDKDVLEDLESSEKHKRNIDQLEIGLKAKKLDTEHLKQVLEQCDIRLAAWQDEYDQITRAQRQNKKRKRDATPSAGPGASPENRDFVRKFRAMARIRDEHHEKLNHENSELARMHNRKDRDEKLRLDATFRVMKGCIENRNNFHISSITKDYETARKELSNEKSQRPLPVHCVSATAFMDLVRGDEAKAMNCGFKFKSDTGVPGLRDALISTTWETRLINGKSFNGELCNAFARLEKWLEDTTASFKMTAEERIMLDQRAAQVSNSIDESFAQLHIATGNSVEGLMEKHLLLGFPKLSKQATTKLRKRVTRTTWVSKPIIWCTHRALNKNNGVWQSSHAGWLDWNEEMNAEFVDLIKKEWTQTIHINLPTVISPYIQEVQKRLTDFSDSLMSAALGISPLLREAFEYLSDSILRMARRLEMRAATILADFDTAAKDAWRLVKPLCEETWMPIYNICGNEKGQGHYARNKNTHKIHVHGPGGKPMYKACCDKLESALRRMCTDLHNQFEEKYKEIMQEFKNEMVATLDQHTMGGDRRSHRTRTSLTKVKLQAILPTKIDDLYKAWQTEPVNEPKEDKNKAKGGMSDSSTPDLEEEKKPIDIDDLIKDRNFDVDSEYENDSNSDD